MVNQAFNYDNVLRDTTIQIPPEDFSLLNILAQAVVELDLYERTRVNTECYGKITPGTLAQDIGALLLTMTGYEIEPDGSKAQTIAAYLYNMARMDSEQR